METLHAPWRMEYILAPKPPEGEGTLFFRVGQSNDDIGHHVVARTRTCYALLNLFPYNGGHLLVAPYRQVAELEELTDEEILDLMRLTRRCQRALRLTMKAEGFNIGINLGQVAGAGIVEHLHIHVVPRWRGDTNFMPVLGGANVLPQALAETAAKLREALAQEGS